MSATLTEAEVIATGRTVLARLGADDFTWPSSEAGSTSLRAMRDGLEESLEDYEDVRKGRVHPGVVFPELEHYDGQAHDYALRKLADDVLAWARAAVLVVAGHCGEEAADALRAAEGGVRS
jgi:hypothetical protein